MSRLVYLNDRFMQEKMATIPFLDLSFQRGYAIFDFFRLVGNQPLHLEDHLDRFYFSAGQMRIPVPKPREELKQVIREMIWENELPDSGIRIQLTGGEFTDETAFTSPTLVISQLEFVPPGATVIENGIKLVSYEHQRQLPQVKSTDYMMAIWLQPYIRDKQADDLLYHNRGIITESPRSNFFLVTPDERVVTPRDNILKGITRMKVAMLASKSLPVEERNISIDEIFTAKEAFITSTTKQIVPVTHFDGKKIGDGMVGPVTKRLLAELREYCGMI